MIVPWRVGNLIKHAVHFMLYLYCRLLLVDLFQSFPFGVTFILAKIIFISSAIHICKSSSIMIYQGSSCLPVGCNVAILDNQGNPVTISHVVSLPFFLFFKYFIPMALFGVYV